MYLSAVEWSMDRTWLSPRQYNNATRAVPYEEGGGELDPSQ